MNRIISNIFTGYCFGYKLEWIEFFTDRNIKLTNEEKIAENKCRKQPLPGLILPPETLEAIKSGEVTIESIIEGINERRLIDMPFEQQLNPLKSRGQLEKAVNKVFSNLTDHPELMKLLKKYKD